MKMEHSEVKKNSIIAVQDLPGLGARSQDWLAHIGVRTKSDLEAFGAVGAFVEMEKKGLKPSLNFLYAMAGALEEIHWQEARGRYKQYLLRQLESARKV